MGIQNNFYRPDVRHMPVISALGRLKQEHEFEANLGCISVTLSNTQHTPKRQKQKTSFTSSKHDSNSRFISSCAHSQSPLV